MCVIVFLVAVFDGMDGKRTKDEDTLWYSVVINKNDTGAKNTLRWLVSYLFKRIQWEQRYLIPSFFHALNEPSNSGLVRTALADLEQALFPMQQDMSTAWRGLVDVTLKPEQYALLSELTVPTELSLFWRITIARVLLRFLRSNATYARRASRTEQIRDIQQNVQTLEIELSSLRNLFNQLGYAWGRGQVSSWIPAHDQELNINVIRVELTKDSRPIPATYFAPKEEKRQDSSLNYENELNSRVSLPVEKDVSRLLSIEVQLSFLLTRFLSVELTPSEKNPVTAVDASAFYKLMRRLNDSEQRLGDPLSPEIQEWLQDKLTGTQKVTETLLELQRQELEEFTTAEKEALPEPASEVVVEKEPIDIDLTQQQADGMMSAVALLPTHVRSYLHQNHAYGQLVLNFAFVLDMLNIMFKRYADAFNSGDADTVRLYEKLFELADPRQRVEDRLERDRDLIRHYSRQGRRSLRRGEITVQLRGATQTSHDTAKTMRDGSTADWRSFVEDWSTLSENPDSPNLEVLSHMDNAILALQRLDIAYACAGLIDQKNGDMEAVDWISAIEDTDAANRYVTEDLLRQGERVFRENFADDWVVRLAVMLTAEPNVEEYTALRRRQQLQRTNVVESVSEELQSERLWEDEFYRMIRIIELFPINPLISDRANGTSYLAMKAINLHALPGYGSGTRWLYFLFTEPGMFNDIANRLLVRLCEAILPVTEPGVNVKLSLDTRDGMEDVEKLLFMHKLLGVSYSVLYEMMDTIGPKGRDDVYTFTQEESWILERHLPAVRTEERLLLDLVVERTRDVLDTRNVRKQGANLALPVPQSNQFKPNLNKRLQELNISPKVVSSAGAPEEEGQLDVLLEYSSIFIAMLERGTRIAASDTQEGEFLPVLELLARRFGEDLRTRTGFLARYTHLLDDMEPRAPIVTEGTEERVTTEIQQLQILLRRELEEEEEFPEAGKLDIVSAEQKSETFSKFVALLIDTVLDDDRRGLYQRSSGSSRERYSARDTAGAVNTVGVGQLNQYLELGAEEETGVATREVITTEEEITEGNLAEQARRELIEKRFRTVKERSGAAEDKLLGQLSREFDVQLSLYMQQGGTREALHVILDNLRGAERDPVRDTFWRNRFVNLVESLRTAYYDLKMKTAYKLAFGLALNANTRWIIQIRALKGHLIKLEESSMQQRTVVNQRMRITNDILQEIEDDVIVTLQKEKALPAFRRTTIYEITQELHREAIYDSDLVDVRSRVVKTPGGIEGDIKQLRSERIRRIREDSDKIQQEIDAIDRLPDDQKTGRDETTKATLNLRLISNAIVLSNSEERLRKLVDQALGWVNVLRENRAAIKRQVLLELGIPEYGEEGEETEVEEIVIAEASTIQPVLNEAKAEEITEVEEIERGALQHDEEVEDDKVEARVRQLVVLSQKDPKQYRRLKLTLYVESEDRLVNQLAAITSAIQQEDEEEQLRYPNILAMVRLLVARGRLRRVASRPVHIAKIQANLMKTRSKIQEIRDQIAAEPQEEIALVAQVEENTMIAEAERALIKQDRDTQRIREQEQDVYLFLLHFTQWYRPLRRLKRTGASDIDSETQKVLSTFLNLSLVNEFTPARKAAVREAARKAALRYLNPETPIEADTAKSVRWWQLLTYGIDAVQRTSLSLKISNLHTKYSRLNPLRSYTEGRYNEARTELLTALQDTEGLGLSQIDATDLVENIKDQLALMSVLILARRRAGESTETQATTTTEEVEEQQIEELSSEDVMEVVQPRRKRKIVPSSTSPSPTSTTQPAETATLTGREPDTPLRTKKIVRLGPEESEMPALEESDEE